MSNWPLNLSKSRILLTNDDGIHAPGLKVLEGIARELSDDVWIVAPETEQSGAGHSLTLRRPLRIRDMDERRYCVDGTPTDCVLLALNRIMPDHRPDLVLSGVNRAGNLGEDVTYSGTVAATMEATILGVPAIAMSQDLTGDGKVHWDTAARFGADIVRKLVARGWPRDTLINVNFPPVPPSEVTGTEVTTQGRRKTGDNIVEGRDPRGTPYYWIGAMLPQEHFPEGSDLEAMNQGRISVTPIDMNMTDEPTLASLEEALA